MCGFLEGLGRVVKLLKTCNVCRDVAGCQRGVWRVNTVECHGMKL